MPADATTKRVYDLIDPIVTEEGCELLDVDIAVECGQRALRVFISKPGGVTIDDCSRVSGAIEDVIEVEGLVTGRYNLEVSSPGLNRPLTKPRHYAEVLGQTVQVQTHEKINGRANYKGILKNADENGICVQVGGDEFRLPIDAIRKAHLVYQNKEAAKPR